MKTEYQILPIADFPGYFIDTYGFVWSDKSGKMKRLKGTLGNRGYFIVVLYKNKKRHMRLIHRLVLEVFIGKRPEGMECRHLNGIKTDNRLDNLIWGTCKENTSDKILHGTDNRGEKNGRTIFTDEDVLEIYGLKGIESCKSVADRWDVHRNTIYNIWNKKYWNHI